jgi:hypothetical protein
MYDCGSGAGLCAVVLPPQQFRQLGDVGGDAARRLAIYLPPQLNWLNRNTNSS